jgi:undecaprenyl-diphosphatase
MDYISNVDTELFFILNGLHTPWLDPVMFYMSMTVFWIPLFIFLIYLIIKSFGKTSLIPLICIAVCIVCTDQITSGIMKPAFARLRPTHEPLLKERIHTVNGYRGGRFGFASSHAANTFGVATFLFLLLRNRYRWISLLFIWALVMSYTRIYLGVHYPGDILVGTAIGILCGWLVFSLTKYLLKKNKVQVRLNADQ